MEDKIIKAYNHPDCNLRFRGDYLFKVFPFHDKQNFLYHMRKDIYLLLSQFSIVMSDLNYKDRDYSYFWVKDIESIFNIIVKPPAEKDTKWRVL